MKPRVLVVDDEPTILSALRLALEEIPCEARTASDVGGALRLLSEEPFDLLILDKNLPEGRSGVELTRRVRSLNRTVPIILVTAFASAESARDTLNLEIEAYLEKPFSNIYQVTDLAARVLAHGKTGWRPAPAIFEAGKAAAPSDPVLRLPATDTQVLVASADSALQDRIGEVVAPLGARALRTTRTPRSRATTARRRARPIRPRSTPTSRSTPTTRPEI